MPLADPHGICLPHPCMDKKWNSPCTTEVGPNTIQQDIHLNIRLAGNSPAGYSAGIILLPITQKIRHTKGFQNIQLGSLYSKSVSHENSKCLHFASVLLKHSSKQAIFSFFRKEWKKLVIFESMGYQRLPEYQIPLLLFKVNEPWKFQMSSFCISIVWNTTVENRTYYLFELYWCKMKTFSSFMAHWL